MMTQTPTQTEPATGKHLIAFFVLLFALSTPIWIVGRKPLPLPVHLPVSALTAFVPALAAAILTYLQSGTAGIKALFGRIVDLRWKSGKGWYPFTLLYPPFLYFLSYIFLRLLGLPLPAQINIPLLLIPVFFVVYFITGIGEELGFTAYATDPVLNRWGTFRAGLFLGVMWALWHSIAFVQTDNSLPWILWQSLKTIAMRMVLVWLYTRSGRSVQATVLYHTTDNIAWSLFPNLGTHYNPMVIALLTVATVLALIGLAGRKKSKSLN